MIVDCIGCLHGYYPQLEGGDLLIVTGDLTARDNDKEYCNFYDWLDHQDYKKKIFICGNHDNYIQKEDNEYLLDLVKSGYDRATYLCDSGTEYEGLKIWASPWTKKFEGQNPKAMAFCLDTDEELEEKWQLIPGDTDILITHGPPYSILDGIPIRDGSEFHVGSLSLYGWLEYVGRPKLHVFSHVHEGYGKKEVFPTHDDKMMISVNCSHVNAQYRPVNKPVRIEL